MGVFLREQQKHTVQEVACSIFAAVLSILLTLRPHRSGGKVYHVLIFHKGGEYSLDVAGEGGAPAVFSSLDDLVVFCMSHKMRMEGDEVGTGAVCTGPIHHIVQLQIL